MNSYTVYFKYAKEHVDATDSDMAVFKAAEIIAQDLSDEDRGELVAIELHGKNGLSEFFYAGADLTSDEVDAVIANAPKHEKPQLPPRRARGMTLTYDSGDLFVQRLGYSASLSCAANEGVLHHDRREEMELSDADMKIVHAWDANQDAYYEKHGWKTWEEYHA